MGRSDIWAEIGAPGESFVAGKGSVAPTMEFTYSLIGIVFLLGLVAPEDSWC